MAEILGAEIAAKSIFRTARFWMFAGAAVALLVAASLAFYQIVLKPMNAKHDIAAAKGQAIVTGAQNQAAGAAVNTVAGNAAKENITHEITRTNTIYITKQPGAGDPLNPALDAAGRHSICLRDSAADLPECQRLRASDPE